MSLENILSTAKWYDDLERKLNPHPFGDLARVNDQLNRYINPMQQLADYAKINTALNAFDWTKSLSALSPTLLEAAYRFREFEKFTTLPTGIAALASASYVDHSLKPFNFITEAALKISPALDFFSSMAAPPKGIMDWHNYLQHSMGSISSILAANLEDEENDDFIDKLNEVSSRTSTLTETVVEYGISPEIFYETLQKIFAELQALKTLIPNKREVWLKFLDRVEAHICLIISILSLYLATKTISQLETKNYEQTHVIATLAKTVSLQTDTIKMLQEVIYRTAPRQSWVTNRKCPVHFTPVRNSIVVDSIDKLSSVDVVSKGKRWVQITYFSQQDTFARMGWVNKSYIDTIRNLNRAGNQSVFNR